MTRNITPVPTMDRLEQLAFNNRAAVERTAQGYEVRLPGLTYRFVVRGVA